MPRVGRPGFVTLAKRERERSTRKQAATISVVTVATDQVGVSASDRPSCSAAIPPGSLPPPLSSPPDQAAAPAAFTSCSALLGSADSSVLDLRDGIIHSLLLGFGSGEEMARPEYASS